MVNHSCKDVFGVTDLNIIAGTMAFRKTSWKKSQGAPFTSVLDLG